MSIRVNGVKGNGAVFHSQSEYLVDIKLAYMP